MTNKPNDAPRGSLSDLRISLLDALSDWKAAIAIFVGILAFISTIAGAMELGLPRVTSLIIDTYHSVIHRPVQILAQALKVTTPAHWAIDAVVGWMVGGAIVAFTNWRLRLALIQDLTFGFSGPHHPILRLFERQKSVATFLLLNFVLWPVALFPLFMRPDIIQISGERSATAALPAGRRKTPEFKSALTKFVQGNELQFQFITDLRVRLAAHLIAFVLMCILAMKETFAQALP